MMVERDLDTRRLTNAVTYEEEEEDGGEEKEKGEGEGEDEKEEHDAAAVELSTDGMYINDSYRLFALLSFCI